MNLNIRLEAISHDAELKMLMLCRERTQYLPEGTRKRIDGAIRELLNTEFICSDNNKTWGESNPKYPIKYPDGTERVPQRKEYNSENGNYEHNAGYAVTPKPETGRTVKGNYTYIVKGLTTSSNGKTETENILEHLGVQMTGTEICKAKHLFENRKREKLIECYIDALRKQEETNGKNED